MTDVLNLNLKAQLFQPQILLKAHCIRKTGGQSRQG